MYSERMSIVVGDGGEYWDGTGGLCWYNDG